MSIPAQAASKVTLAHISAICDNWTVGAGCVDGVSSADGADPVIASFVGSWDDLNLKNGFIAFGMG